MPDWNTLFLEQRHREPVPEAEVYRVVHLLEERFPERPLRLWDLGCGAGRHTVALAKFGYDVHGSDTATNGVKATQKLLLSWFNGNRTFELFMINHHERRKVHAKKAS
jgi:2-polyprenyl-3-methyl-5-hydroxy-6-metoxy-1,4-benzoquinol methylase